nr:AAA family ATPase [Modestobacter marinus]
MGAGLALYEDVVPLTSYGLGSRRLASLAVQQLAAGSRSVAVVDEIESGLEPHRAVRLLAYLLGDDNYAQVLVTTHSPVIVEQATIENLATVQNQAGYVTVTALGGSDEVLQRLRRARPSSLLARRVIVAEGKTEHGVLLEFLDACDQARAHLGYSTSAGEGVAIQDGNGGTEVPLRSHALAGLGFSVAALCDNDDRAVDGPLAAAQAAGVTCFRWEHGHNIETQICSQLQEQGLVDLLALAVERRNSEHTVLDDINSVVPGRPFTSLAVGDWLLIYDMGILRAWVAKGDCCTSR